MSRGIQRRIEKLELAPPRALAVSRMTDAELEACIKDSVMQDIKASGSFEVFCKEMEKEGEIGAEAIAVAIKYRDEYGW